MQAAELIDSEFRPGMSNRQKNKAKRMAKLVAKQRSRDMDPNEKRWFSHAGLTEIGCCIWKYGVFFFAVTDCGTCCMLQQ